MHNTVTKTVFITGATSGIGKATATLFAKKGYHLIVTGRRERKLLELKRKLETKYFIKVKALTYDVRDYDSAKKAYSGLSKEWKKIDILVNNAGLAAGLDPIHRGKLVDWERMIDTNIKGLLYMTRLISPGMVKRKSGMILNVCSTAGHEVYPNGNVYCATKHAVDALTRASRVDLHKYGIRVGQISPGHVEETEFALVRFDGNADKAKIYNDFQPLRSKDVAEMVWFMANRPKHVSIQDIIVTGTQQANSNFIDRSGR